jgi:hypothetical protein
MIIDGGSAVLWVLSCTVADRSAIACMVALGIFASYAAFEQLTKVIFGT